MVCRVGMAAFIPKNAIPSSLPRGTQGDHVPALSADLRVRKPPGRSQGRPGAPSKGFRGSTHWQDRALLTSGFRDPHFVPVCPLFFLYASMEKRRLNLREFAETAVALGVRPNTLRVWRQRECIPARWALKFYEHYGGPVEISDWVPDTASIAD